jgi:hypothetical protein
MSHKPQARLLIGLTAAAGAFGVAAMVSATTAPSARADDFGDVLSDVSAILSAGQTDFSTAATDFAQGTSGDAAGLTALFEGIDDDLVGAPNAISVGLTDLASGDAVLPATDFEVAFTTPATYAAALTESQASYAAGVAEDTVIQNLPATDYTDAAYDNFLALLEQWVLPGQILDIGEIYNIF